MVKDVHTGGMQGMWKQFATMMELWRATYKLGTEVPELCEECRKKAITDVMAATYGR